jgi:hypothetical protein
MAFHGGILEGTRAAARVREGVPPWDARERNTPLTVLYTVKKSNSALHCYKMKLNNAHLILYSARVPSRFPKGETTGSETYQVNFLHVK